MVTLLSLETGASAGWNSLNDTVNTQGDSLNNFPVSSRAAILGTADLLSANGTEALYLNPAGLSAGWRADIQATYVNLAENTRFHFLGFHFPFNERLALGLGWGQLASVGFEARDANDQYLGRFDHLSNNVVLGLGFKPSPLLRLGANIKYLDQELASYHENALALDAGLVVEGEHWGIALAIQNAAVYAGDPYWGLRGTGQVPSDVLDLNGRLGGHWKPAFNNPWLAGLDAFVSLEALKLQQSFSGYSGFWQQWNAGLEYTAPGLPFTVRVGLSPQHFAAGAGVKLDAWQLDYSLDLRADQPLHWVSLKWEVPLKDNASTLHQIDQNFDQAVKAYQAGDYATAIKRSSDILLLDPNQEQAKLLYWQSQRDARHNLDDLLLKAKAYVSIKAFDDAFEILKQGSAMALTDREYLLAIEQVRFYAQEEQQVDISRLIKAQEERALASEKEGNWVDAMQLWEGVLLMDPENQEAPVHLQDISQRIRNRLNGYFNDAVQAMQQVNYWQAVKLFNTILKLSPGYTEAKVLKQQCLAALSQDMDHLYTGMVEAYQSRKFDAALNYAQRLKAVAPQYRQLAKYLPLISEDYNRIKNAGGVVTMVKTLAGQHRLSQALTLLVLLQHKNALNYDMMQLKSRFENQIAQAARLRDQAVQAYQEKQLDDCIALLRRSLTIDQNDRGQDLIIQAYISAGVRSYRRDDLSKAIVYWEAAEKLDQQNGLIQTYLKRARNKQANLKRWQ